MMVVEKGVGKGKGGGRGEDRGKAGGAGKKYFEGGVWVTVGGKGTGKRKGDGE